MLVLCMVGGRRDWVVRLSAVLDMGLSGRVSMGTCICGPAMKRDGIGQV